MINSELERNLRKQFILFTGLNKTIALPQISIWFKQAGLFDEFLTLLDIEKSFNNLKSGKIDYVTFNKFLRCLFAQKNSKRPLNEYLEKLISCGPPAATKIKPVIKVEKSNKRFWNLGNK